MVCLLTKLLRDGEAKETERWREICCSQGIRFFSWVLSVFFFSLFCCGRGATMRKWMRGLMDRGCVSVCDKPPVKIVYIVRELLSNRTLPCTSSVGLTVCLPTIPSLTICINIAHNTQTHIMLININFCGEAQTHSISVVHTHETHCSVCSAFSHCLYLKHNEFCAQSLSIFVSLCVCLSLSVAFAL